MQKLAPNTPKKTTKVDMNILMTVTDPRLGGGLITINMVTGGILRQNDLFNITK